MCLAALLCEQFLPIREWVGGAKISIKSYFMEIIFFSVHSAAVYSRFLGCHASHPKKRAKETSSSEKMLPFGVNCRLQLAGLGRKEKKV